MTKDLEKLREIYLADDVDSEDYKDNLDKITEWETILRQSENFINWQKNDTTKEIIAKAKESYKQNAMKLGTDRELSEIKRNYLWAKQDAILWLISLMDGDYESTVKQINNEIKQVLRIG